MLNTILDNVGTIICFRSKSPVTEELMLHQFSPYVAEGEIGNLSSFNFYIKIAAVDSQEPLSGTTLLLDDIGSEAIKKSVIAASRERYATQHKEQVEDMPTAQHDVSGKTKLPDATIVAEDAVFAAELPVMLRADSV